MPTNISLNYDAHCPEDPAAALYSPCSACSKCCRLNEINSYLTYQATITNTLSNYYKDLIDNGNTASVLNMINSGTTTGSVLQNTLLSYSPYLSDTVMALYFSKPSTSASNITAVHNANKPVSSQVWQTILSRSLSGSVMGVLNSQQSSAPLSTRKILDGQLILSHADLQSAYANKLNYFISDTLEHASDSVIALIKNKKANFPDAPAQLVDAYRHAGKFTEAFSLVDSLSGFHQYAEIMRLEKTLLKLDTSANKAFSILNNKTLRDTILAFANDTLRQGAYQARAILNLVYGKNENIPRLLPEEFGARLANNQTTDPEAKIAPENSSLFEIYPNPANESFTIFFKSDIAETFHYYICNVWGQQIMQGNIKANDRNEIETKSLINGLYVVSIDKNTRLVAQKKLVIAN